MDTVAEMLNRIKTAGFVGKDKVVLPYSKFRHAIADSLAKEGYVKSVSKKGRKANKVLEITLAYDDEEKRKPKVSKARRISRPARRIYGEADETGEASRGRGTVFVSTPKGVLSHRECEKENVGGEFLFHVW